MARMHPLLKRARAFYGLAGKARKAHQYKQAEFYTQHADRLVRQAADDKARLAVQFKDKS